MPLPKMPTKPAVILSKEDFPKASAKSAIKAVAHPSAHSVASPSSTAHPSSASPANPGHSAKTRQKPAVLSKPVAKLIAQPAAPQAKAAPVAKLNVIESKAIAGKPANRPKAVTSSKADGLEVAKLFVLDTNVLMHDPSCLFRFEEHDVYLPMITLEELDNHKKGMSEVARNARQVSRTLDALVGDDSNQEISEGIPL